MGKIISFSNQKGGVGKTTSAVNIAASLGILGHKALLIDLDPQGNATSGVGIAKKALKCSIHDVLTGSAKASQAVIHTEFENLDIIPTSIALAGAEYDLYQGNGAERVMKNALDVMPVFCLLAVRFTAGAILMAVICGIKWKAVTTINITTTFSQI